MNQQLEERYSEALQGWGSIGKAGVVLSPPQLLHVPTEYAESPIRLMIVGQENGGWGVKGWDPTTTAGRDLLYREYDAFALAHGNKVSGSPFWRAAYKVSDTICPQGERKGFLWTNLCPISQDHGSKYGRATPDIEMAACSLGLLRIEIEVTKPDVVIFFTNGDRDPLLKAIFPNASIEPDDNMIARIRGIPGEPVALRTKHPKWLAMNNPSAIGEIGRRAAQALAQLSPES